MQNQMDLKTVAFDIEAINLIADEIVQEGGSLLEQVICEEATYSIH